jgi:hypothetical protein
MPRIAAGIFFGFIYDNLPHPRHPRSIDTSFDAIGYLGSVGPIK